MYSKYTNFRLLKKHNFVELNADEICVLENEADDSIFEYKKPCCLINIVNKKLSLSNLYGFHIVTLKVNSPNRITDYRKIWNLAGFAKQGLYDGNYNCIDGRIYLGVYKDELPSFMDDRVNIISLYLPVDVDCFDNILHVFEVNGFTSYHEHRNLIKTLKDLQKSFAHSIVIFEFPKQAKVYVIGQGIENRFADSDIPKMEIIEK